jgi:hypothetical protein
VTPFGAVPRSTPEREQFARMGGKVGGKRRAEALMAKRRSGIAKSAASQKWVLSRRSARTVKSR